ARERIRRTLQRENASSILVDEKKLVLQGREALAQSRTGPVVNGQVRSRESRRHPKRSAAMNGQRRSFRKRRPLLARGVRELVAPQRAQVHAHVAEDAECAVEAFSRVAFGPQSSDVCVPLVAQSMLDRLAYTGHARAVLLPGVELFQLGIHLHEAGADPVLEGFRVVAPGQGSPLASFSVFVPCYRNIREHCPRGARIPPACGEGRTALPQLCRTAPLEHLDERQD